MKLSPTRAALFLAVALALPAAAQEWTAAPNAKAPTAAQQKQLDAARAQLDAAAKRYGELARQFGGADVRYKVEQRLLRKPVIGVVLAPDDNAGVRIAGVTPDSAAADAGVKSGDRIVAIDDTTIVGAAPEVRLDAAREALGKHGEKSEIKLRVVRDGQEQFIELSPRGGARLMFYGPVA
jgi:S1-C subfamily serine protease